MNQPFKELGEKDIKKKKGRVLRRERACVLRNGKKNGDKEGMSPRKQRRWEEVWSEG